MPRPIKAIYRRYRKLRRAMLPATINALPAVGAWSSAQCDLIVQALFSATLRRAPDPSGRDHYCRLLQSEQITPLDLAHELANSNEARELRLSRATDLMVQGLYRGILGRGASAVEIELWTGGLLTVTDLARVINEIENSAEARRAQLNRILAHDGLQSIVLAEKTRRENVDA